MAMAKTTARPADGSAGFRPASLDAVNFLLADVRGALGPYLNVFLVTQRHWSQTDVGLVTTIGGLLGLVVQTPIGAAIDATRAKRGAIVAALAVLAAGAATIFAAPLFWPVLAANTLMAVVGDVFGPAVAALTLGPDSMRRAVAGLVSVAAAKPAREQPRCRGAQGFRSRQPYWIRTAR
jgi:MFS family permease